MDQVTVLAYYSDDSVSWIILWINY